MARLLRGAARSNAPTYGQRGKSAQVGAFGAARLVMIFQRGQRGATRCIGWWAARRYFELFCSVAYGNVAQTV